LRKSFASRLPAIDDIIGTTDLSHGALVPAQISEHEISFRHRTRHEISFSIDRDTGALEELHHDNPDIAPGDRFTAKVTCKAARQQF
jgi:hypothetical protein